MRTRRRRTLPAPTTAPGVAARRPFICPRCQRPGQRGDRVTFVRGEYAHVGCAGRQLQPEGGSS